MTWWRLKIKKSFIEKLFYKIGTNKIFGAIVETVLTGLGTAFLYDTIVKRRDENK